MVNENFEEFINIQKKHKGQYIGHQKADNKGITDNKANRPEDTDKSIGASGREL